MVTEPIVTSAESPHSAVITDQRATHTAMIVTRLRVSENWARGMPTRV